MKKFVFISLIVALAFVCIGCNKEVQFPDTIVCSCGGNHDSTDNKDDNASPENSDDAKEDTIKFQIKNSHYAGDYNADSSVTFKLYDEDYVLYRDGTIFSGETISINHCKKGDFVIYLTYSYYSSGNTKTYKKYHDFRLENSSLLTISGTSSLTYELKNIE